MRDRKNRRKGNALIEFTLVGIALMFVLISTAEMARGMWIYHTLAHAVRTATRYAIVHGANCNPAINAANNCLVTVGNVATVLQDAGVGLLPEDLTITAMNISLGPTVLYSVPGLPKSLATLRTDPSNFPPATSISGPGNEIVISIRYNFRSALAFFWPGAGPGFVFGAFNLPASSRGRIEF